MNIPIPPETPDPNIDDPSLPPVPMAVEGRPAEPGATVESLRVDHGT
ncbi:hypothetical protein [Pseudomonas kurunegalensis]|nr:hypothetical protein [Pseudomonas kurunegalensis]WJD65443.1 hypothetical protein QQ992_18770 [Pseudomonas kurunegalensis]